MMQYALNTIIAQGIREYRARIRVERTTSFGPGFWRGFTQGLAEKFGKGIENTQEQSTDLTIYDPIKNKLKEFETVCIGHYYDKSDVAAGQEAGKSVSIHKPITTQTKGNLLK